MAKNKKILETLSQDMCEIRSHAYDYWGSASSSKVDNHKNKQSQNLIISSDGVGYCIKPGPK